MRNDEEDKWWALCSADPIQAMESPLFDLIMLAEPQQYAQFELYRARRWVDENLDRLPIYVQRRFATECCDHANYSPETTSNTYKKEYLFSTIVAASWESASKLSHGTNDDIWQDAVNREIVWQWRRLVEYIKDQAK